MRPIDLIVALMVAFFWGLNFVVAKVGLAQLPPVLLVTLRFALVAVILVPLVRVPCGRLKEIALLSVTFGVCHFSLMFNGLARVDAAVAAITIQIQVPFAALLGAVLYHDPPGWRRLLGMTLAIAGVGILAGGPQASSALWAVGLIVAAALVWSVANVQMKRLSGVDGFALNGWVALMAAPQLFLVSLATEQDHWRAIAAADWRVWGTVAYQAVIVVILCYGIWFRLLRDYSVNQVMPFTLLVPLFGVVSGVLLLDEPLSWNLLVGGLATIAGVAIILFRRPRLVEPKTRAP
ncbi:MAG: EamA family transporter [Inquilinus sp.]|nr:EamA family transporter [Inquilinus sp.]